MRKGSLDERLYEALMEETEVLQPFMQGISEVAQLGAKIKGKERFQTHHRAQLFLSQQEKQFIQENFIKREQLVLALKGMVEERKATELKTQSSFNNGH